MKVAVVGCGAVGSFYGAKLTNAGHEVHFLLRSDFEHVREHGVRIESTEGDLNVHPIAANRAGDIGPADLVIVAIKTTANHQLQDLLPPLVHTNSIVLTLQNGLGNVELLSELVPKSRILGGLCFVCLNRVAPGVIRHIDYGLVVMGEREGPPSMKTIMLLELFKEAGITCRATDDLQRAQWEKLVWNIPFNGLGVASAAGYQSVLSGRFESSSPLGDCMPTDALLADARWESLVRELMFEVIVVARALGYELEDGLADKQIERTKTMGAYRASTLLDFMKGGPLELESIFLEPLRQAKAVSASVPRLESLCRLLQAIDAQRCRADSV